MKKKVIAAILIFANVFGLAACTVEDDFIDETTTEVVDENKQAVFETIEDITEALADCDYDSLKRYCNDAPTHIQNVMPIPDDTTGDDVDVNSDSYRQLLVENMIANTITCEIDEASFNSGIMGSTCSVYVTFMYKDYHKVLEHTDLFVNPGDFNARLLDVTDMIKRPFTLKFKKHYNEYLLINGDDLVELYDFKDTSLQYMQSFFDMVDRIYMTGEGWDDFSQSYYNTDTFEIVLVLNQRAEEYIWQYIYRVSREDTAFDWTHLYTSKTITDHYPSEIHVTYSQSELFDDGTYVILFYNYYDDTIIGYEFDVYNTTVQVTDATETEPTEEDEN